MQNKNVRVEIVGNNANESIDSVTTPVLDSVSNYKLGGIEPLTFDDSLNLMNDFNITNVYVSSLDKYVYIYPIYSDYGYMISFDRGENWTFNKFCTNDKILVDIAYTTCDTIVYADEYFYACPRRGASTQTYLRSKDGIIWETMHAPLYGKLCYVIYRDNTLYALFTNYTDTILYSSSDNGETWTSIYQFTGEILDRVIIGQQGGGYESGCYVYSQYGENVYYSSSTTINVNISFTLASELSGVCKIILGNVSYYSNPNNSNIETYTRFIAIRRRSASDKFILLLSSTSFDYYTNFPIAQTSGKMQYSLATINSQVLIGEVLIEEGKSTDKIYVLDILNQYESQNYKEYNYGACFCNDTIELPNEYGGYSNYNILSTIKLFTDDKVPLAYKSTPFGFITDNFTFEQKNINTTLNTEENRNIYQNSNLNTNMFAGQDGNVYNNILFSTVSSRTTNSNGNYDYTATLLVYGNNIQHLILYFDKDNEIYPTRLIINGIEYSNNSYEFNLDLGYGRFDSLVIHFLEINKPNTQLGIGGVLFDVNSCFNRLTGLKSINVEGVSDSLPYYGVISCSGSVSIIDKDGILQSLNDLGLLYDVAINIYVNNNLCYTFYSNNEIEINNVTKEFTINLIDDIESLQDYKTTFPMYFSNMSGYQLFQELCSRFGYPVILAQDVYQLLQNIYIENVLIEADSWWNIWQSFCTGTKSIFLKSPSGDYIIKGA